MKPGDGTPPDQARVWIGEEHVKETYQIGTSLPGDLVGQWVSLDQPPRGLPL